jgi:hypothetical protein
MRGPLTIPLAKPLLVYRGFGLKLHRQRDAVHVLMYVRRFDRAGIVDWLDVEIDKRELLTTLRTHVTHSIKCVTGGRMQPVDGIPWEIHGIADPVARCAAYIAYAACTHEEWRYVAGDPMGILPR